MFAPILNTFDPRFQATMLYLNNVVASATGDTSKLETYREYYDGDQKDALTTNQRLLLGEDVDYTLNICKPIVDATVDRLKVQSITVGNPKDYKPPAENPDAETLGDKLTEAVQRVLDANMFDEQSTDAFTNAGIDGNSYLILDYTADEGVTIAVNTAWDDTSQHGVAPSFSDTSKRKPDYYFKQWSYTDNTLSRDRKRTVTRRNVYYPNRVEKWLRHSGEDRWKPHNPDNLPLYEIENGDYLYDAAVSWLTDDGTPTGNALGFPAFHLKVNAQGGATGKSDLAQVAPGLQDTINQSHAMLSAAEQFSGTPIVFAVGTELPDELEFFPGSLIQIPEGSNIIQVSAADLGQLNDSLDKRITRASVVAHVPISAMNATGQIVAEGTLQQMDVRFVAKCTQRQKSFGNVLETLTRGILHMLTAYDESFTELPNTPASHALIDDLPVTVQWHPAEIRNEDADVERAAVMKERLDVPKETAWKKSGQFTSDEIQDMLDAVDNAMSEQDAQTNQVLAGLMDMINGVPQDDTGTDTSDTEEPLSLAA